jgi:hypothetical protein
LSPWQSQPGILSPYNVGLQNQSPPEHVLQPSQFCSVPRGRHSPLQQSSVVPHAVPQPPQLSRSLYGLVQTPSHEMDGGQHPGSFCAGSAHHPLQQNVSLAQTR